MPTPSSRKMWRQHTASGSEGRDLLSALSAPFLEPQGSGALLSGLLIFFRKPLISRAKESRLSDRGAPCSTFSTSLLRKSSDRNIRLNSSFLCSWFRDSIPLSRI